MLRAASASSLATGVRTGMRAVSGAGVIAGSGAMKGAAGISRAGGSSITKDCGCGAGCSFGSTGAAASAWRLVSGKASPTAGTEMNSSALKSRSGVDSNWGGGAYWE